MANVENKYNALNKSRRRHRRCSIEKDVLKIFCKFHRKTSVLESLFNKVAGLCQSLFFNKVAGLSLFCEIFKNTYFEHLRTTASGKENDVH